MRHDVDQARKCVKQKIHEIEGEKEGGKEEGRGKRDREREGWK